MSLASLAPKSTPVRLLLLAVIVVAVAGVVVINNKQPTANVASGSQSTKGDVASNQKSKSNPNPAKPSATSNPKSLNNAGQVTLLAPSGDFVSNHHPNLSGSPAPNTMGSICNTTPAASCTITFTNATTQVKKSLTPQQADANGSTYWYWKLQDIGLTSGTWHVSATASLGGQSKTSADAMDLVVQP